MTIEVARNVEVRFSYWSHRKANPWQDRRAHNGPVEQEKVDYENK